MRCIYSYGNWEQAEKDYLDNVLKSVDPVIDLDEDQRRVALSDEDYTLVIAGAGAGKKNYCCS